MNTRPLPPNCRACGGEGANQDDAGRWRTCASCSGTGEASAKPFPAGLLAAACITAAVLGSLIPSGWWAL